MYHKNQLYINTKFLSILLIILYIEFGNNTDTYASERKDQYDLIILGGGITGISAAFTANKLGKKVLIINEGYPLGGVGINIGPVPTKHLVSVAENINKASREIYPGFKITKPKLNIEEVMKNKEKIIKKIKELRCLKKISEMKNVSYIKGWAKLKDNKTVVVNDKEYIGNNILIATGAVAKIPNVEGLSKCDYLTFNNSCALAPNQKTITIIGAGFLGIELAFVYKVLGLKVTIIDQYDKIFKRESPEIGIEIQKALKNFDIELILKFKIEKIIKGNNNIKIIGRVNGEPSEVIIKDKIFLATGIKGRDDNMNLQKIGIKYGRKDLIKVDKYLRTSVKNIYAAGDCADTPIYAFACLSDYEARVAVQNMFLLNKIKMEYHFIPWVAFTFPQIAGVGLNEYQAEQNGYEYDSQILYLKDIPKGIISYDDIGFIKLIRNKKDNTVLGARIVSPCAGEMISHLGLIVKNKININEICNSLCPYLTYSEGIRNTAIKFNQKECLATDLP